MNLLNASDRALARVMGGLKMASRGDCVIVYLTLSGDVQMAVGKSDALKKIENAGGSQPTVIWNGKNQKPSELPVRNLVSSLWDSGANAHQAHRRARWCGFMSSAASLRPPR